MNLLDVKLAIPRHKRKRRLGRGIGSGRGKTAGRGHKGQKARSGYSMRSSFEGGQMPLARRVPKRGFNNTAFGWRDAIVNVGDLASFSAGAVVDAEALKARGLVGRVLDGIRLLGDGEVSAALTVRVRHASASARTKVEAAGGRVEVVGRKPPPRPPRKKRKRKRKKKGDAKAPAPAEGKGKGGKGGVPPAAPAPKA